MGMGELLLATAHLKCLDTKEKKEPQFWGRQQLSTHRRSLVSGTQAGFQLPFQMPWKRAQLTQK